MSTVIPQHPVVQEKKRGKILSKILPPYRPKKAPTEAKKKTMKSIKASFDRFMHISKSKASKEKVSMQPTGDVEVKPAPMVAPPVERILPTLPAGMIASRGLYIQDELIPIPPPSPEPLSLDAKPPSTAPLPAPTTPPTSHPPHNAAFERYLEKQKIDNARLDEEGWGPIPLHESGTDTTLTDMDIGEWGTPTTKFIDKSDPVTAIVANITEDLHTWEDLSHIPRPILSITWYASCTYALGLSAIESLLSSTVDATLKTDMAEWISKNMRLPLEHPWAMDAKEDDEDGDATIMFV